MKLIMADTQKLNIVDKNGKIIGEATRENIHKNGILHREIHVWFYTPEGEIIFQHRAKNKDIYPDLLDATVGGHVEAGANYINTALKEIKEETGITADKNNLHFIQINRDKSYDSATCGINNAIRSFYAYYFKGGIEDLQIEKGEAVGFEVWPLKKFFNISKKQKERFVPAMFEEKIWKIFSKIQKLMKWQ